MGKAAKSKNSFTIEFLSKVEYFRFGCPTFAKSENVIRHPMRQTSSVMKRILKIFLLTFSGILFLGILYFLSKWNRIYVDEKFGQSQSIKNLNKKVYDPTFLIFDSTTVKTDLELFENHSDTVTFNFSANKSPRSSKLTFLNFNSGDGFAGVNINVIKYKNFSYASAESYTDNIGPFDFLKSQRYIIKKQKLTLNKSEYNKGDSIYGMIELEIKFTPTNEVVTSKGHFRSVVD